MPMNGDVLAKEVLAAIGGEMTPERNDAFVKMCRAIVEHIQKYGLVSVATPGVFPGPATLPGTGKVL